MADKKEKDTTNALATVDTTSNTSTSTTETKVEDSKAKSSYSPLSVTADKKIPTKKVAPATNPVVMGTLRSANAYPCEFIYKKEKAFIPPNGRIPNVQKDLLTFPLPDGVKFVPNN